MNRKKRLPLSNEKLKLYQGAKEFHTGRRKILKKIANHKNYLNFRDYCHFTGKCRGAAHNVCNLELNMSNEILVILHNGSKYDYHFAIKELQNEF